MTKENEKMKSDLNINKKGIEKTPNKISFRIFERGVPAASYLSVAATEGVVFHFGQSAVDIILLRLFNKKTGGFYIDVGAHHPRRYSNTYVLYQFYKWNGINIDASREAIDLFMKERPEDINIHAAVGLTEGDAVLWKFDYSTRNTISEASLQRQLKRGDIKVIGEERVHVRPLADIISENISDGQIIDLLNVDAEGMDLEVLKSNDWKKYRPRVVLVEDHSFENVGIENSEIASFMKNNGYKLRSHAFDTSIYCEEGFIEQANTDKKPFIENWRSIETDHDRIRALIKAYLKDNRCAEENEWLNAGGLQTTELIRLEKQFKEEEAKSKDYEREYNKIKQRYDRILQSRTWRYTKPIREIAGMFKRFLKSNPLFTRYLKHTKVKYQVLDDPIKLLHSVKPLNVDALKAEYIKKGLDKVPDNFVLYRIIGNDLYPRHKLGQTRENLQFILENEPHLENCEKRWVVNRIINKDEERAIIKLLQQYNQEFIHIPFYPKEYKKIGWDTECLPEAGFLASEAFNALDEEKKGQVVAAIYRQKNNYVMNNNGARNAALRDGKTRAKWILPWDGNCFITLSAWEKIRHDVITSPYLKYFAVPMTRVLDNCELLSENFIPNPVEEPQLIFRKDSREEFNQDYCYGRRPKVELFWRLGIPGKWDRWEDDPWDQKRLPVSREARQFGVAGWVARLSSGMNTLEQDTQQSFKQRGRVRQEAIINTLRYIDVMVAARYANANTLTNLHPDILEDEYGRYQDGSYSNLSSLVNKLIEDAEAALERGPYSVKDKTTLPPSGNPNDYWHPASYWWPNPKTRNGLPYIRRDGERVPGTRMYEPESDKYDRTRLQRVIDDSIILALAWKFSGEMKYAQHAAKILERFFMDPATRMNPHMKYAQVIMGHNNNMGASFGIIEMKDMYYYLDAVRLLTLAGAVKEDSLQIFKEWLSAYLKWLLDSPQGQKERKAANNHGTYYDLQVAAIASFLDEKDILFDTLIRAQSRIAQQFAPDGSQPEELRRTTTAHYCCFNFQGWINLAVIASRWGTDLWSYKASNGASLIKGAQWLLSHAGKDWPYKQIDEFDPERFLPIWFTIPKSDIEFETPAYFPDSKYNAKPIYFPHDGIRPYWNLGNHFGTIDTFNKNATIKANRFKYNERFLQYISFGMIATIEKARDGIEQIINQREKAIKELNLASADISPDELKNFISKLLNRIVTDNVGKIPNNAPVTMGISSGYDSRAILAVLNKHQVPITTYTFGQEGNLDFDFAKKYYSKQEYKHLLFDTSKMDWSLEEYEKAIINTQNYPISPQVIVAHKLSCDFPFRYEIHGYLNGSLTGNTIPSGQSMSWKTALDMFCEKNNPFRLQDVLGEGIRYYFLPDKPFLDNKVLSYDRQLDLSFRQLQRIRPVDSVETKYILPFEDYRWAGFWLTRPFQDIAGQSLYIWFLKNFDTEVFFDLKNTDSKNRNSMRKHRIQLMYGENKPVPSIARPKNPTAHFCLFTCYLNNESFRKMLSQSISRLKGRKIFDVSFIEDAFQRFKSGDENAAAIVNGLVSVDLMLEVGVFE